MRDFYRRLNVDPATPRKELRAVLMGVTDRELRDSGAAILLDKNKRAVYDRDRQVALTIGKLRSHLGLYLAPFWARSAMSDFTFGQPPATPSRKIDELIVKQAFSPDRYRRRRNRYPEIRAAIIGGVAAIVLLLAAIFLATHNILGTQ